MTISIGQAIMVGLVLTRILGMILIAPVFGARVVPLRFRVLLAVVMSLLVIPVSIRSELPAELAPIQLSGLFLGEMAIGLVFGLSLKLIFTAIELAGRQFAGLCGTQFPGIQDGMSESASPPIAKLYGIICLLMFVIIGGHRRAISGLLDSFQHAPPGHDYLAMKFLPMLVGMLAQSFEFAIRLSAPIVLASLLALLILGIASRGLPHFNLMQSSFTINSILTLLVMIVMTGTIEVLLVTHQDQVSVFVEQMFAEHERSSIHPVAATLSQ